MKILGLTYHNSGCGYHRIFNPLAYMDGERHVTDLATPEIIESGWDIIVFNRTCEHDKEIKRLREITGAKIVVDMDDEWVLPPGHVNYREYLANRDRIERNMMEADAITCTHDRLAERCRQINENVWVIPNAIPFGRDQFTEEKIQDSSIRLFWAGGISHVNDIEMLRRPMRRISTINNVKAIIGGYSASDPVTKSKWDRMVSAFTNSLKIKGMVLPSLPVNKYMSHHVYGDIMIVPLENGYWHSMKSNLKLLEAACKRMPVIVSKVNPYIEGNPPALYVENQRDWYDHVRYLVNNPGQIKVWGDWLYSWAKQFDLIEVNKIREKCYQSILSHSKSTSISTTSLKEPASL